MSLIYRYADSLWTPCGKIVITCENTQILRFSVKKNPYRPDYYLFPGTENAQAVNTDTNYLLCVHTSDLMQGCIYNVRLVGSPLHFGSSDEHTEAVSGTANGYSIAIGAYDPNDDEKMLQALAYSAKQGCIPPNMILPPPQYDERRFVQYDVQMLADYSGFSFRLLDRSVQEIIFPAAWVKNKYQGLLDYEAAVELWTT